MPTGSRTNHVIEFDACCPNSTKGDPDGFPPGITLTKYGDTPPDQAEYHIHS